MNRILRPQERDVRHKYEIVVKGAIPEVEIAGCSIPILGESSLQTASLKQGLIQNVKKYWLDNTSFTIKPDTGVVTQLTGTSMVSPALGSTVEPSLIDNTIDDWESVLRPATIAALNESYRTNLENKIKIIQSPSYYRNYIGASEYIKKLNPLQLREKIVEHRQRESELFDSDEVSRIKLCFTSERTEKNKSIPAENSEMSAILKDVNDHASLMASVTPILVDLDKADTTSFISLGAQMARLVENLDIEEIDQEIFGYPDIGCVKKAISLPNIPYEFIYKNKLPIGVTFIIRLYIKDQERGSEKTRMHIDLGKRLRLTIDASGAMELGRKRSNAEVEKGIENVSKGERGDQGFNSSDLREEYKNMGSIEKMESAIEALYLSTFLYDKNQEGGDGDISHASIIDKLNKQKNDIDNIKGQMEVIKKSWRNKSRSNRGLDLKQRAERKSELDAEREKIKNIRKRTGIDEAIRRKIKRYEKILYTQTESITLSNMKTIMNNPLEIRVTDYNFGVVLFDFNNGKDIHVFKDKDILSRNLTLRKRANKSNNITVLDDDSYEWLIADSSSSGKSHQAGDEKQAGATLKVSGSGGEFSIAVDTVVPASGTVYIPVVLDSEVYQGQKCDISLVTNLQGYGGVVKEKKEQGGLKYTVENKGGKITAQLMPPKAELMDWVDSKDLSDMEQHIPGFSKWIRFVNGVDVRDPNENYSYLYFVKVTFTPGYSGEKSSKKLVGLPLLFRGHINVHAKPKLWSRGADKTLSSEDYVIVPTPVFDGSSRSVSWSIKLSHRASVFGKPENAPTEIPDFLVGKRVDLKYKSPSSGGWHYLMTDGIVTDSLSSGMLAVSRPNGALSGFKGDGNTETYFNLVPSMNLLNKKMVNENLIVEGYNYITAIKLLFNNGGFDENKLSKLVDNSFQGKRVNTNKDNGSKYIPISLPGSIHSLSFNGSGSRLDAIDKIVEMYGFDPSGNVEIWEDREGFIRASNDLGEIGTDPIFGGTMIYKPKPKGAVSDKQSRYIYYISGNDRLIQRRRMFEGFFSSIKIFGATDPATGKQIVIGAKKREAIDIKYKDQDIYSGSHIEKEPIQLTDIKEENEIISRLRYEWNRLTYFKEEWKIQVPMNNFIRPKMIIYIEPTADYNSGASSMTAWRVKEIQADVMADEMTLTVEKPSDADLKRIGG